jgi:hypothetical protein
MGFDIDRHGFALSVAIDMEKESAARKGASKAGMDATITALCAA